MLIKQRYFPVLVNLLLLQILLETSKLLFCLKTCFIIPLVLLQAPSWHHFREQRLVVLMGIIVLHCKLMAHYFRLYLRLLVLD
jgi:hypothetical protein